MIWWFSQVKLTLLKNWGGGNIYDCIIVYDLCVNIEHSYFFLKNIPLSHMCPQLFQSPFS